MNEKTLFVGDIVINKKIFHERKHPVNINNVDINKIIISNKDSFEAKGFFEYVIGYRSIYGIIPLYINLPQISGYVKCFDETKLLSFVIKANKLIESYKAIRGKVGSLI